MKLAFRNLKASAGFFLLLSWVVPCSGAAEAETMPMVRLQGDAKGSMTALIEGRTVITLASLQQNKTPLTMDGIQFSLGLDEMSIRVSSSTQPVRIESSGYEGWSAKIPANCAAQFRLDPRKIIDINTPAGNQDKGVVTMKFSDGATAEMRGEAAARLDLFKDQSYYFSGYGRSSAGGVFTASADSLALDMSPKKLPLSGGPWVELEENGRKRSHRALPLVDVFIKSEWRREMVLLIDRQECKVTSGEKNKVSLTNGAVINLWIDDKSKALGWEVEKGFFRFNVAGFDCWKAYAVTDQSALTVWDARENTLDIRATAPGTIVDPNRTIYVKLSKTLSAAVYPSSVFQYSPIVPCQMFTASSTGERVTICNSETRDEMVLASGNSIIRPGFLVGGPVVGNESARQPVNIAWQGGRVNVNSPVGVATLGRAGEPNDPAPPDSAGTGGRIGSSTSEKMIGYLGGDQFYASHETDGSVTIEAKSGSYVLIPRGLDNFAVDLPQDNSVTLTYDSLGGVFTVRTSPDNSGVVRVGTPDGYTPSLPPGAVVTFILGQPNSMLASASGNLFFYENLGTPISGGDGGYQGGIQNLGSGITPGGPVLFNFSGLITGTGAGGAGNIFNFDGSGGGVNGGVGINGGGFGNIGRPPLLNGVVPGFGQINNAIDVSRIPQPPASPIQ